MSKTDKVPLAPSPKKKRGLRDNGVAERVREVARRMSKAQHHSRIEHELSVQWGVDPRTIRTYISQVYKYWAEISANSDVAAKRDEYDAQFIDLAEEAREMGDYGTAARILKERAKLYGAYAPTKVQLDGNLATTIASTRADDVRSRIAELANKHPDLIKGKP